MIIEATIEQLRTYCPLFSGRVAGAAAFQQGLRDYNANMVLPAAYVIPLEQESDGNRNMVGVFQVVRKTVGVVVELNATPDRRGQWPAMSYDEIEKALFASLLNWPPAECITLNGQGYFLTGGRFLDLDRARLFYQWEFALNYQLDDTDAWTPPSVPLESIELDIYTAPPWETPPPDGRPPAAVVKIPTATVTIWDGGVTTWDAGITWWDAQ